MSENWVTVETYVAMPAALEARERLHAEGIECLVVDQRMSVTTSHSSAASRVALQVRESESMRAYRLLKGIAEEDLPRCEFCDSTNMRIEGPRWMPWVFALAFALVFPPFRLMTKWRCRDCMQVQPLSSRVRVGEMHE
jgi:hypothetical protein